MSEQEIIESEQIELAKERQNFYGVCNMPPKAKGGAGRFAGRSGLTKGVRSGRMKVFYQDGRSPADHMQEIAGIGSAVIFIFKGKPSIGMVEKFNEHTFTVSMGGVDRKVPVRYDKFVSLVI